MTSDPAYHTLTMETPQIKIPIWLSGFFRSLRTVGQLFVVSVVLLVTSCGWNGGDGDSSDGQMTCPEFATANPILDSLPDSHTVLQNETVNMDCDNQPDAVVVSTSSRSDTSTLYTHRLHVNIFEGSNPPRNQFSFTEEPLTASSVDRKRSNFLLGTINYNNPQRAVVIRGTKQGSGGYLPYWVIGPANDGYDFVYVRDNWGDSGSLYHGSVSLSGDRITESYADLEKGDPNCCPSYRVTRRIRFRDGTLEQVYRVREETK
ncbi:MAG: hypothetical protein ABEJ65_12375 [bacterium]